MQAIHLKTAVVKLARLKKCEIRNYLEGGNKSEKIEEGENAKNTHQTDKKEKGMKSRQIKRACTKLEVKTAGVVGTVECSMVGKLLKLSGDTISDFNAYRQAGHSGRFDKGTNNRAVSVATLAAYETLRGELGNVVESMW